ncbi:hypothetical protein Tco_0711474 [Tanacetum coccineum]
MGSNRKNNSPLAQQRFEVNPQMVQMQYPNPMEKRYKLYNVSTGLLLSTVHTFYPTEEGLRIKCLVFMEMMLVTSVHCLVLSSNDFRNITLQNSEFNDHSNEPSSSKLVPKVVPLAVKTATSRQELELLFHHHIAMLRTTEPEDLPKDNPKLEIAVLRPSDAMHNPSHSHSGSSNQKTCHHLSTEILTLSLTSHVEIVDIE